MMLITTPLHHISLWKNLKSILWVPTVMQAQNRSREVHCYHIIRLKLLNNTNRDNTHVGAVTTQLVRNRKRHTSPQEGTASYTFAFCLLCF